MALSEIAREETRQQRIAREHKHHGKHIATRDHAEGFEHWQLLHAELKCGIDFRGPLHLTRHREVWLVTGKRAHHAGCLALFVMTELKWTQHGEDLAVTLPRELPGKFAYVLKIVSAKP